MTAVLVPQIKAESAAERPARLPWCCTPRGRARPGTETTRLVSGPCSRWVRRTRDAHTPVFPPGSRAGTLSRPPREKEPNPRVGPEHSGRRVSEGAIPAARPALWVLAPGLAGRGSVWSSVGGELGSPVRGLHTSGLQAAATLTAPGEACARLRVILSVCGPLHPPHLLFLPSFSS